MSALPAGPRGYLRVNLRILRDPIGSARQWREQFGDPMTYPDLKGKPCLVTGSPEGLRSLLGLPPASTAQALVERLGAVLGDSSLLAVSGAPHAAMRKLLMPPFHGQRMRLYGAQICEIAAREVERLRPGVPFAPVEVMNAIGLEVIVQAIFGVTTAEGIAHVTRLVEELRKAFPRAMLPLIVPWLRRELGGIGPWARLQRAIRALRAFLAAEIRARRNDSAERDDILSLLVAARPDLLLACMADPDQTPASASLMHPHDARMHPAGIGSENVCGTIMSGLVQVGLTAGPEGPFRQAGRFWPWPLPAKRPKHENPVKHVPPQAGPGTL